jgi:hypothetical protein
VTNKWNQCKPLCIRIGTESEKGSETDEPEVCDFRCQATNECISQDRLCDGIDDCGDNEDEENDCEEGKNNIHFKFEWVLMDCG